MSLRKSVTLQTSAPCQRKRRTRCGSLSVKVSPSLPISLCGAAAALIWPERVSGLQGCPQAAVGGSEGPWCVVTDRLQCPPAVWG